MSKKLITQYVFTPGAATLSTVVIPGRHLLEKILLITNVTKNVILYNFANVLFRIHEFDLILL